MTIVCANCGEVFLPKIKRIQIYCKDPECTRQRKRYYMRRFMRGRARRAT